MAIDKEPNTPAQKTQIARINRKLSKQGYERLYTSRGWSEILNLGDYHIVDTYTNAVLDKDVNLDDLEAFIDSDGEKLAA